jgi:hypothetical protein
MQSSFAKHLLKRTPFQAGFEEQAERLFEIPCRFFGRASLAGDVQGLARSDVPTPLGEKFEGKREFDPN